MDFIYFEMYFRKTLTRISFYFYDQKLPFILNLFGWVSRYKSLNPHIF